MSGPPSQPRRQAAWLRLCAPTQPGQPCPDPPSVSPFSDPVLALAASLSPVHLAHCRQECVCIAGPLSRVDKRPLSLVPAHRPPHRAMAKDLYMKTPSRLQRLPLHTQVERESSYSESLSPRFVCKELRSSCKRFVYKAWPDSCVLENWGGRRNRPAAASVAAERASPDTAAEAAFPYVLRVLLLGKGDEPRNAEVSAVLYNQNEPVVHFRVKNSEDPSFDSEVLCFILCHLLKHSQVTCERILEVAVDHAS